MKKTFKILALAVVSCVLMTACGNSENDEITDVATKFLLAINVECDFGKAKEYATPQSYELLDQLNIFFGATEENPGFIDVEHKKRFENTQVDILKIDIENDSMATVIYEIKVIGKDGKVDSTALDGENSKGSLPLRKIDGQWLVHQPKEMSGGENVTFGNIGDEDEELEDEVLEDDTTDEEK